MLLLNADTNNLKACKDLLSEAKGQLLAIKKRSTSNTPLNTKLDSILSKLSKVHTNLTEIEAENQAQEHRQSTGNP